MPMTWTLESYNSRKLGVLVGARTPRVRKTWNLAGVVFAVLLGAECLFLLPTRAESVETTSVYVQVNDAETSQPIYQARLTLQFREPGSKARLKRSKLLAFSAKTNNQGRYRFTSIPKGTVRLIVTSEHHQSFSKEFEIDQDNQELEVKLKKPQPLL
jgi:carboxypeptidase family protein